MIRKFDFPDYKIESKATKEKKTINQNSVIYVTSDLFICFSILANFGEDDNSVSFLLVQASEFLRIFLRLHIVWIFYPTLK